MLGKYSSFQCLAGACPSTCCAGWSILVDEKDYMRFKEMEPEWLRYDILSNILERGQARLFKNSRDGRCAMLDADGLCRIQRNTSESFLCNTCRKYPRVFGTVGEVVYISMAASCPVVSEYLVNGCVGLQVVEDSGRGRGMKAEELSLTEHAWHLYKESRQHAKILWQEHSNELLLYQCFEKMASEVLDIIMLYYESSMPADLFEALEMDMSGQVKSFVHSQRILWNNVSENYMEYRIFSRKIEFPREDDFHCVRQAQGELLLLRTLAFCRYCEQGALIENDWQELLQRVYRFSAHGKKVSEAFGELLKGFFSRNVLWSYILI